MVYLLALNYVFGHWQLQLALQFTSEEQVDQDIVVALLKPIFDSDDSEHVGSISSHLLKDSEDSYEILLRTCAFASEQVSYFKCY